MANGTNPVNVLLGNRELLVAVFAALFWLLKKLGVAGKKDAARPASGGRLQTARTETDDQVAERTRRVQDEVRRKIAERRAAATPPKFSPRQAPEEILPRRSSRPASEDGPPIMVPRAVLETETEDEAVEFARQQKLEGQMRALDAARAASVQQAAALASGAAPPVGSIVPPPLNSWLLELRDPGSFRRAILLREVLGPPLGLKDAAR